MLIYVCSSSHGFGHAARDAAVLQQLRRLRPDWRLVLSSAVDSRFLRVLLGDDAIEQRSCRWDVGMVQADALGSDPTATLKALAALDLALPKLIDEEARWIAAQGTSPVVLGDVPPAAADLAGRLQAPLVWMSNFGWDDIYRPFAGDFLAYADRARTAYAKGQLLLRCPFDLAMDWGVAECSIGLVCSQPRPLPASLLQDLTRREGPLVQVGFGGMGLRLDPELFAGWPDFQFVMAPPWPAVDREQLAQVPNLLLLPEGLRPLDLFPHCARHLGKPGFSTFSEALSQRVGLHVVDRRNFAEVEALIQGLKHHGQFRLLTRAQLVEGDWQLDQQLLEPESGPLGHDGAFQAALAIVDLAEQDR